MGAERVFVHELVWFGVGAAGDFMTFLKEWQRGCVRWVGVEVVARDLGGGSGRGGEPGGGGAWRELCGCWEGVWVVRIVLAGRVDVCSRGIEDVGEDGEGKVVNSLLNARHPWVQSGLRKLRALRRLEIGIEDATIPREAKNRFCRDLQGVLSGVDVIQVAVGVEEQKNVKVDGELEADVENVFEGWGWESLLEGVAGGFVPMLEL